MKLPLDRFLESLPDQGKLVRLQGLGSGPEGLPWAAVMNQACIIGPVTVCCGSKDRLHALDLEDGTVIADFASGARFGPAWEKFRAEAGRMRPGTYLALHGFRSYNFWHWTMEALVRLIVARMAGFDGYVIVPPALSTTRFVFQSLEIMGIGPEKILPYDGRGWLLERLMVVKPIDGYYGLRWYPQLLWELRRALLSKTVKRDGGVRLYVSRKIAREGRRVVNEDRLMEVLEPMGFKRVIMERLSLDEQVGLASRAVCLVGAHGAGMAHSLFMEPGSLVLELFSQSYVNPCILPIVDIMGHRYFMYPSSNFEAGDSHDIMAPVYAVELTLRRELGVMNRGFSKQIRQSFPACMG